MTYRKWKHHRKLKPVTVIIVLILLVTRLRAGSVDPIYNQMALVGVNRINGQLMRYDFDDSQLHTVGPVQDYSGQVYYGIDASAYIPGHLNIFSFWTDPADGLAKLLYINTADATAGIVGQALGSGHVTGAVAAMAPDTNTWYSDDDGSDGDYGDDDGDDSDDDSSDDSDDDASTTTVAPSSMSWSTFAVLQANDNTSTDTDGDTDDDTYGDSDIDGDNEDIDDDTNGDSDIDADFTTYNANVCVGDTFKLSDFVSVPTGLGLVLGVDYTFLYEDSETWHLSDFNSDNPITLTAADLTGGNSGPGEYRVSLQMTSTSEIVDHMTIRVTDCAADNPSQLVEVNHYTGKMDHMMTLSRTYNGLASADGQTFYATSGNQVFLIDPINGTETLIGTLPGTADVYALGFAGTTLMGFDNDSNVLTPIDTTNGAAICASANIGMQNLGTIVFMPLVSDPTDDPVSFD